MDAGRRGYLPRTTGADYAAGLLEGQRYLYSLGVTAWQDAIVGAYAGMDDPGSTYLDAAASGDLRRRRGRRAVVGPAARASSRSPTWSGAARR